MQNLPGTPLAIETMRRNLAKSQGGFTAALVDSAMTNCMFACGLVCMSGALEVRFRHVVEIGRPVRARARLEQEGEVSFRG